MTNPILDSLAELSLNDPPAWAAQMSRMALVPGAGVALRASMPGWNDVQPNTDEAKALLTHPDANPEDRVRCFANATFATRMCVIARNGVIGAIASHIAGGRAICDDLSTGIWRPAEL